MFLNNYRSKKDCWKEVYSVLPSSHSLNDLWHDLHVYQVTLISAYLDAHIVHPCVPVYSWKHHDASLPSH